MKLTNLVATDKTDGILGHLFWFSIGNILIHHEELDEKLKENGIDREFMPNAIRISDAFRRATTEVKRRKDTEFSGMYQNLLVAEVVASPELIIRKIVIETIDRENVDLTYEVGKGEIELNKENESFSYSSNDPEIIAVCEEVEEKFHIYRNHYGAQALRAMIPKIMDHLAVTPMRKNGGVYFVPANKTEGLTNLVEFINSLEESEAYKVPVVSNSENNDMINKKLDDHLQQLLKQCENTDDLKKGQIKALINETNIAIDSYKEYRDLTEERSEYFLAKVARLKDEVLRVTTKLDS